MTLSKTTAMCSRRTKRRDVRMMAVMVFDTFVQRFIGLTKRGAAPEVARLLNRNEKTIRKWHKEVYDTKGQFCESTRGKYARFCVLDDEQYKSNALTWIRANAIRKGMPNMKASSFQRFLNTKLLPAAVVHHPTVPKKVSLITACRWLHILGFHPSQTKKGI